MNGPQKRDVQPVWRLSVSRISLLYLAAGAVLMLLAGQLMSRHGTNQVVESTFYIVASSLMIYFLICRLTAVIDHSQNALRDSEERFRALIETSPDAIVVTDLDGTVCLSSQQAAEMLNLDNSKELIGRNVAEYVANRERSRLSQVLDRYPSKQVEYTMIRHDGSCVPVEASSTLIFDRDGSPTSVMGIVRDITERKEAERKHRELEANQREFYRRTILAATGGKLLITDRFEINTIAGSEIESWEIETGADLSVLRAEAARIARDAGMDDQRTYDFKLAIGEMTTNAYKHGGGGLASIHRHGDAFVFIVSDHGPGIETLTLPDVALVWGYSTAGTLGMGYKAILVIADRTYLATGPDGTTVGIEMSIQPAEISLDSYRLPDILI